jgi:hypothetical protein
MKTYTLLQTSIRPKCDINCVIPARVTLMSCEPLTTLGGKVIVIVLVVELLDDRSMNSGRVYSSGKPSACITHTADIIVHDT